MSCDFYFFFLGSGEERKSSLLCNNRELCEGFKTARSGRVKQIFEIRKQTKNTCITKQRLNG